MKHIRTQGGAESWKQGRTFIIEVTEGDLLQMARVSWVAEGGPEFPSDTGPADIPTDLRRLHRKVKAIAPDIAERGKEPITPEDTI